MLDEGGLLNSLSDNISAFSPGSNAIKTCADKVLGSTLKSQSFVLDQPNRPLSHPSRLCVKDIATSHFQDDDISSEKLSFPRPSSTPASTQSRSAAAKHVNTLESHVLLESTWITNNKSEIDATNDASISNESVRTATEFTLFKDYTPSVTDFVSSKNGRHHELVSKAGDLYSHSNSEVAVRSEHEINNIFDSIVLNSCEPTLTWGQTDAVKSGLKRPRSATITPTSWFDGDPLMRPLSAPKRLFEGANVSSSNLNCILTSGNNTPVQLVPVASNNAEAPKSTLEALVASTSPLMFFPHEFSVDPACKSKPFIEYSSQDSHSMINNSNRQNNSSYSIDLVSPQEFPMKAEADFNTNVHSISSSKSMASLDLSEPNLKAPDSQGSHKSNFSDLGLNPDCGLDHNTSATLYINEYVQAMRTYAAELCPVDCVIFLEHCRPFNCDTLFMKYFRDQYLSPILSNLNGGPPLNADFGRDAYTSLYSLHGYCWRNPLQSTTLVSDTPIIYRILKRVGTMQHEARHANERIGIQEGTPGHELLQAAVREFDSIDRARRGLCKRVQRHLILLSVSPINLDKLYQRDSSNDSLEDIDVLINLKQRGVALSVFSPVHSPSLLKLYELVNGVPASQFHDRRWQTVALSGKLLQCDVPERRIIGPIAAAFHAQTEAELSLLEQKQQSKQILTNGHPNKPTDDSDSSSQTFQPSIDPNLSGRYALNENQYRNSDNNSLSEPYCTVAVSNFLNNTTPLMVLSTDNSRSNQQRSNSSMQSMNNVLSPMTTPQFTTNASPVGSYQRAPRNSSVSQNQQPTSTPPAYLVRNVGVRNTVENARSVECNSQPNNSLSTGNSGPNSVDQGPGSAYGSESVATPQAMYPTQAGTMSPQQIATVSHPASQLNSPVPSGGHIPLHQQTPGAHSAFGSYHSNVNQMYQYQQSLYDAQQGQGGLKSVTGPPSSPGSVQLPFRPPSNAASPTSQMMPTTVNLSSPCSSRAASKQYSPQLTSYQQGSPQHRLSLPPSTPKPVQSQGV